MIWITRNIAVISNVFGVFGPRPLNDRHSILVVVGPRFHRKEYLINRHIDWSLQMEMEMMENLGICWAWNT